MLQNGFIALHRSLLQWEWYDDINTKTLFIHLLLTANYESKVWHGIAIERGQRLCSVAVLSSELCLTSKAIRTALNHLKQTGEVAIKTTNKYTLLTLVNYSKYQDIEIEGTNKRASKTANKGQAKGKKTKTKGNKGTKITKITKITRIYTPTMCQ